MSDLSLRGLTLAYGRKTAPAAVRELDLEVPAGQLVSLLGPSGCGKTTTMRAVAGLLAPQAGRIVLGGEDITAAPAHRRDIGLVFQSYALFPHLSAFENVAFGLRLRRVAESELKRRVDEALASVDLAEFGARQPAQLSGGQQQRVALARAMVIRPRLLLLDEPLSNLDAALRLEMRAEVRRLQRALGTTMLYVTHDQDEALALSDRIVVMRAGRIEQDAAPDELYERPATAFVAGFMGHENLFEWRDGALHGPRGVVPLVLAPGADEPARSPIHVTHLAWRPMQVPVLAAGSPQALPGRVLARSYLGDAVQYLVETALGPVKGSAGPETTWQEGDAVSLRLDPARAARLGSTA
ncbi:MAG: ABC transporter ATP-binding protein [Burkholderiales bacterium]|nr:ABC transporter ATP-binding protein [Burkholderiales bacterium]